MFYKIHNIQENKNVSYLILSPPFIKALHFKKPEGGSCQMNGFSIWQKIFSKNDFIFYSFIFSANKNYKILLNSSFLINFESKFLTNNMFILKKVKFFFTLNYIYHKINLTHVIKIQGSIIKKNSE